MKIALLSDIHGNILALEAIAAEFQQESIEHCLIAGDFLGYYYSVEKVFQLLGKIPYTACLGNHEELYTEWDKSNEQAKSAWSKTHGMSFETNHAAMSVETKRTIACLQHPVTTKIEGRNILLSHGSPWDINEYIYPDKFDYFQSRLEAYAQQYDLIVLGHTHKQLIREIGQCTVVNPGSVGQPRDRASNLMNKSHLARAQWSIYDSIQHRVELKTTNYDVAKLELEINNLDKDNLKLLDLFSRR